MRNLPVLLVNPDYAIERYMGRHFGRMGWVMPPMGLLYLAAALERRDIGVAVYDAQVAERPLAEVLVEQRPEVVGVTCASALVESTLAAAALVKEHLPGSTVVVGGPHPTVRPDDLLSDGTVDVAVRGEGLDTLVELVEAVAAGRGFEEIRGVSFRGPEGVVHTPARPPAPDVDAFPLPARHLVPMHRYRMSPDLSVRTPFDIVFTSYGCPFDCSFCAAQVVMGGSFRPRAIAAVIDEVDLVIRNYRPRWILAGDDNFVTSKERALEFCEAYIRRGHHRSTPWQVSTRADSVDAEVLGAMSRAGCEMVSFGLESAVPRLLETVSKGLDPAVSERAVRLAKAAGLKVRATFILGLPGETPQESLETIRFSRRLPLDQVRFALATPFPGTRLWDTAVREGVVDDWMALSSMGGYRAGELFYVPEGRGSEELKRLQRRANFGFYFRPRIMLGFAGRVRSLAELVEYARAAWGLVRATLSPG